MTDSDYLYCARRIGAALQLQSGERVLLKLDPRVSAGLVASLQREIRGAGAVVCGVILAEETRESSALELAGLRRLFDDADVFIWLPEMHQGNRPALARAIEEWLDSRRGRALHFHWHSGSYPLGTRPLPPPDIVDRIYLEALQVSPAELDGLHQAAIPALRAGPVRVTTPEGTDISFVVGDRPFCSQVGDASRERMRSARTRIDRDVELPAGVLRVAPLETSVNGSVFLPVWRPVAAEGRDLTLQFRDGYLASMDGGNALAVLDELTAAGGSARMFREFALGFNPALRIREPHPFIGYYGYGAGIVRLSLGDNQEMGGLNRGGGVYWNFLANASVTCHGVPL